MEAMATFGTGLLKPIAVHSEIREIKGFLFERPFLANASVCTHTNC